MGQWIQELARDQLSRGKISESNKIRTFGHLSDMPMFQTCPFIAEKYILRKDMAKT